MIKTVFTRMNIKDKSRLMGFALDENGKAIRISCLDDNQITGNIYIGRVERVVEELGAAFVIFDDGQKAYMDLPSITDDVVFTGKLGQSRSINTNDELLIQIVGDAKGSKCPTCTANISFTSEHLVITPVNQTLGVSKKIDGKSKEELKKWLESKSNLEIGIVARTAAKSVSFEELDSELEELITTMNIVVKQAATKKAPILLYKNENVFESFLKGIKGSNDISYITDCADVVKTLDSLWVKSDYYTESYPLIKLYSLERELDTAIKKVVYLPCGGNIVFDNTEALTVIDVNSSGASRLSSAKDINLEAASEIMRQLIIRNISGIVIIDFINMSDDDALVVENKMKALAKLDPTKTKVLGYTRLGLCEITRKKEKKSLYNQIND